MFYFNFYCEIFLRFLVVIGCLSAALAVNVDDTIYAKCDIIEHGSHNLYACIVNKLSVDVPDFNVVKAEVTHLPGKGRNDVEGIFIEDQHARYLPVGIENIYVNLTKYLVVNSQLEFLGNVNFYKKLQSLILDNNLIREIPKKVFSETVDLEWLSMDDNRIEELPEGLFDMMPKLHLVSFSGNKLRSLSGSLFTRNVNIERLNFNGNQLTTIGVDLVSGTTKLRAVNFDSNICINEALFNEHELIEKLTKQFKNFCSGQCENMIERDDKQIKMIRDQNMEMMQQRDEHKADREIFCRRQRMLAMSSSSE